MVHRPPAKFVVRCSVVWGRPAFTIVWMGPTLLFFLGVFPFDTSSSDHPYRNRTATSKKRHTWVETGHAVSDFFLLWYMILYAEPKYVHTGYCIWHIIVHHPYRNRTATSKKRHTWFEIGHAVSDFLLLYTIRSLLPVFMPNLSTYMPVIVVPLPAVP